VIAIALRDRPFYGKNGGITISGGEPAAQPEFANAILMGAKEKGLSTCIQTCGMGINKLDIKLCDYIYYDIKAINRDRHHELTGTDNNIILDSLAKIASVCPEKITSYCYRQRTYR
jgi:pyruvate formate lyase activating enzyme